MAGQACTCHGVPEKGLCCMQTINQLAVNALLLNQDRCTKNWYMYQAPASNGSLWTMLSYDLKSALGVAIPIHQQKPAHVAPGLDVTRACSMS